MDFHHTELYNTYSIVARDPQTGQVGVAVQTHQIGVGRIVPWMVTGVGAVATQSLVNISYGPMALAMLREGLSASAIIASLIAGDKRENRRQVAVITADGDVATHTGTGCIAYAGHHTGDAYSVQANMMNKPTVIEAMRHAYENTQGELALRMMASLEAAQAEDGDIRGMQSAAMKIVPATSQYEWETDFDLRVDESAQPLTELARLVRLRRAQHLDNSGHVKLGAGDVEGALADWQSARQLAPDLEEIAYWQAVTLADANPRDDSISIAAQLLHDHLVPDAAWAGWRDLIGRLVANGLMEREGAGDELLTALDALSA